MDTVPQVVSPRQLRLALAQGKRLDRVERWIKSLPSAEREVAWLSWEYSTVVERDNPLIAKATVALDWSSRMVDDLFRLAATL
jgi:hypothetical protein